MKGGTPSALRRELPNLLRYAIVGGIVFVFDVGCFQALLLLHVPLLVTTFVAYTIAIVVHFALNKYFNFRSFRRTAFAQFRTYMAVQGGLLLMTLFVVHLTVEIGREPALIGKGIAIGVNFPLGFLAHRFLTFEAGILSSIRRAVARVRSLPERQE